MGPGKHGVGIDRAIGECFVFNGRVIIAHDGSSHLLGSAFGAVDHAADVHDDGFIRIFVEGVLHGREGDSAGGISCGNHDAGAGTRVVI